MMSLLSPLNVNCHASDGRKVIDFLYEINFMEWCPLWIV